MSGNNPTSAMQPAGVCRRSSGNHRRPCKHSHAFSGSRTSMIDSRRQLPQPQHMMYAVEQRGVLSAATDIASSSTTSSDSTTTSSTADTYFPSRLPPTEYKSTKCCCVKEDVGLWVLQQDFPVAGPAGINLNSVVMQLANGNLLVVSPVAPTPQCLAQLQQLPGTVQHILIPSCSPEHFYYTAALAQQYPEATVWVPPGLFDSKLPGLSEVLQPLRSHPKLHMITDEAFQQQLGSEVQFSLFDGGFGFQEATVYLKAQKAIVFSDLAFAAMNDEGMPLAVNKAIGKMVGIYKKLGSPIGFWVMSLQRAAAQEWARPILGWDFDTVCGGHLTAAIPNGKEEFKRCFSFLL